jgi:hypothetical protein
MPDPFGGVRAALRQSRAVFDVESRTRHRELFDQPVDEASFFRRTSASSVPELIARNAILARANRKPQDQT